MLMSILYGRRFFPYYVYNILVGLDEEGIPDQADLITQAMLMLMLFNCQIFTRFCRWFLSFTGKGCVYSYDPVGSYEREFCRAAGSGASLLQPLLDQQVLIVTSSYHIESP
jgi:20S proteasome subunit beta 6